MKQRVLFLCTHNSCRSQMAEALINHDLGNSFEAFSAGTEETRVNPTAALVLTELGIDTSRLYSKTINVFDGQSFDHVITLCGDANDKCPLFYGGVKRVHIGFDDPSRCKDPGIDIMAEFRRVRDEIRIKIADYLTGSDNE